jgi:mannonate dehydratase
VDGAEDDLAELAATVRNVGAAGIGVLGMTFLPGSVWRTSVSEAGRGGALVSAFRAEALARGEVYVARRDRRLDDPFVRDARFADGITIDEPTMWENFTRFVEVIGPVAEEAGVRIALHPDDPPVPSLAGIARILRSVDALERALEIANSPAFGLNLCLGTLSSAGGQAAVLDAITRFGPRGQIVYVHFRDVRGTVPSFAECFLGEGNYDPALVLRTLLDTGFDGFILDDHVPRMVGDTDYCHRGRSHAIGYLQALMSLQAGPAA